MNDRILTAALLFLILILSIICISTSPADMEIDTGLIPRFLLPTPIVWEPMQWKR